MRVKVLLVAVGILVGLSTMGSSCINDDVVVAINLSPLGACGTVNPGNGFWSSTSSPINVAALIPEGYNFANIQGFHVSDIVVKLTGTLPSGNVSGSVSISTDNVNFTQVLAFNGPYAAYASPGVSLLNPGTLITKNPIGVNALVTILNNRPTQVYLRSTGSGPAVIQSFQVCVEIQLQADVNITTKS